MTNPCPPECLAVVLDAQAHNNAAQASNNAAQGSNNAQTAQLLGRLSASSVAAIPVQAGIYNITAGPEAGQVWERPSGGGLPVRRPELEAASRTSIPQLVVTPEQFGAVGDGITDDQLALSKACKALQARGFGQLLLSQTYRIGPGNLGNHKVGALELLGGDRYEIIFTGGAELLMDNLLPGTRINPTTHQQESGITGQELGGIYFAGPLNSIAFRNPRVRWKVRPSWRSQGDGILGRGYPGDSGPTIKKCVIDHAYIENTPQAHIGLLGVSDPHVIAPQFKNGRADGMHFNACRRPVVTGVVRADGIGDDALAFVTYYGPNGAGIYPNNSNQDRVPFSLDHLHEWSNGNGYADKVEVVNGVANGCRLNGALNVTVGVVDAKNTTFGFQTDGTKADSAGHEWTVQASKGCVVNRVVTDGCYAPVLGICDNVPPTDPDQAVYREMDVYIGHIQTRNTTGPWDVRVSNASGLRFGVIDTDGDVLFNNKSADLSVSQIKSRRLILDEVSGANIMTLDTQSVNLQRSSGVTGATWKVGGGPTFGLYVDNLNGLGLHLLDIDLPNRTGDANAAALLLSYARNIKVVQTRITHDDKPVRVIEIGGGGPDGVSSDIDLGNVDYWTTAQSAYPTLLVQEGPYAARNVQFHLRSTNDGGKNWLTRKVNTYGAPFRMVYPWHHVQAWGDSITEDPASYVAQLQPLLGRPVTNLGISGQTSAEIAARAGAVPVQFTRPDGGVIPGNGGGVVVNLTSGPNLLRGANLGYERTLGGSLGGVRGILSSLTGDGYGFYADPGPGTTFSGPVQFVPDVDTQALRIIRVGRNDPDKSKTVDNVRAMIDAMNFPYRFVVVGLLYLLNGAGKADDQAANAQLKALAESRGGVWYDPNPAYALASGVPNPALYRDNVHPNEQGQGLDTAGIAAGINSKGW